MSAHNDPGPDRVEPTHPADDVRETNRCRLAHQMHMFDLFPWHIAGYTIERCVNCGLTRAEIRALIDGSGCDQ